MTTTMKTDKEDRAARRLKADLQQTIERLQTEAGIPTLDAGGDDFLDVAQGIESQELARLTALRLTERARRLRTALTRVSEGHYGVCTECGDAIPPKRLLAIPDATTCVACQQTLERLG